MVEQYRVCLPPDPNPKRPSYVLPQGACDTHFHIYGPPDVFPYTAQRRYTPPAAPLEHCLMMQQAVGLGRGVVVQASSHGLDNAALLDAIARSGGRFLGVAQIDDTVSTDEIDRLHEGGVRGARFTLVGTRRGNVEPAAFERCLERMARRGWSVDLHIDPEHLIAHEDIIRAIPMPVVVDHIARVDTRAGLDQPAMALLLDLLRDGKFWVKLSGADKISADPDAAPRIGLPYGDVVPYARTVIAAAPDRVMWGSDWPHSNIFVPGHVPSDGALLDLLAAFAPDEKLRNRILVDNPARLYGFDG